MTDELVVVGRVGRPHGIDGSFFVEGGSDSAERFARGATLLVDGVPAEITGSKRGAGGRFVIKLDRPVPRGATLAVRRDELPEPEPDAYYVFQLVGLDGRGGGRPAARRRDRRLARPCERRARARLGPAPADRRVVRARSRSRSAPCPRRPRLRRRRVTWSAVRLDVFTQVPHAFAWMTEQRPLAAVLGTELELRLFNYRDTTPLRSGQVDDEPYGGGAGMVLRVDVVAAALEAVYGGEPEQRVDRADAAGPAADAGGGRGARLRARADAPLVPLRGLRRADRHAPLLGCDLDRPVRPLRRRAAGDGAARRDRAGASRAPWPKARASTRASPSSSKAASSTRTTRARPSSAAGRCPRCSSPATTAGSTSGAARRAASERPQ